MAVLGLGGLGHMAVKFAVAFGAEVSVLSTSPDKEQDAYKLGAHNFYYTKDEEQVKKLNNQFDFIVSNMVLMDIERIPSTPIQFSGFSLLTNGRSISASSIGGIPETQEMLDFCALHNIVSDIELININYINEAYERVLKSDVKYRFVIDCSTI